MNSEWQSFLTANGATIVDERVSDFGAADEELQLALSADTLCDLSHDALISAGGEEAESFLQGQLTNDVRTVDADHHQLSSYCSPKGRMLVLFRLFQRDGNYYLQFPRQVLEPTLKRLRMFVLMAKVELDDASDKLVRFTLNGPNAEKLLSQEVGPVPKHPDEAITTNGITMLRVAGPQPRFILHGDTAAMQALWQSLQAGGARPIGAEAGRLQDIHAGVPAVWPETVEAFVPQMVNLQYINGVSFKKGCYTGQEVVARMQYLGKLKRRMYLAHVEGDEAPTAGDDVYSPASASGQGAGKVVTVAPSPKGGYDILAVIEIASADADTVYLDGEQTRALEIMPLPYKLEQSESSPQATG